MYCPLRMLFLACTLPGSLGQSAAPTDVTAAADNGQITVTLSGVWGAQSYKVYYSTTPGITRHLEHRLPMIRDVLPRLVIRSDLFSIRPTMAPSIS